MTSETLFLQPVTDSDRPLNFAEATGSAQFFNFSQTASGSLNSVDFDVLVNGGVAVAIANAEATFVNDPAFTNLFTQNLATGEDGTFTVRSRSATEVVADFEVAAGETFTFDFTADLNLTAREIENPDAEFSRATSRTIFLVLDVSHGPEHPQLLDFFGLRGNLVSSEERGNSRATSSEEVSFTSFGDIDLGGDNGTDFVSSFATGNYERTFDRSTQLAVVEINTSFVKLRGDDLIDTLGTDVLYGTLDRDILRGTNRTDRIYGSLGRDELYGRKGDDILEGGRGRDTLAGGGGDDRLHGGRGRDVLRGGGGDDTLAGGNGRDILTGGSGSDVMTGGLGRDRYVFRRHNSLLFGERDIITDFEIDRDRIEFRGWNQTNSATWFDGAISQGQLIDTQAGTLFTSDRGGELLLAGINVMDLSASNFTLA